MKIGILGGGQLARMLALAGYPLGLEFSFVDPAPDCCARHLGSTLHADYRHPAALTEWLQQVDIVTYENENIPVATAEWIAAHKPFYPAVAVLRCSQDRLLEKQLFQSLAIPTVAYIPVKTQADLLAAGETVGYPFILKTRREGYDGKGQFKINHSDAARQHSFQPLENGYIAEQFLPFEREISMIGCRSVRDEMVFYEVCENTHEQGVLVQTINRKNDPLAELARKNVQKVLEHFAYVGTLVIEFFVRDNQLIANEMAPRVHNSGHWTIEGAVTSQFENHLRALMDYPLGITESTGHVWMGNLLGQIPPKTHLLSIPGLHLHDYVKAPKPGRKVGHVTYVSSQPVDEKALRQQVFS